MSDSPYSDSSDYDSEIDFDFDEVVDDILGSETHSKRINKSHKKIIKINGPFSDARTKKNTKSDEELLDDFIEYNKKLVGLGCCVDRRSGNDWRFEWGW